MSNAGRAGLIARCASDFKTLQIAVVAYTSINLTPPSPPGPWTKRTYKSNFAPLLSAQDGGPFMNRPLRDSHDVIEYDGAGHVWVEPRGQFDQTYNPAHNSTTDCSLVIH